MPRPPWSTPRGIEPVVDHWLASGYVRPCLTADETMPSSAASHEAFPGHIRPSLVSALRARGVSELYSHQAKAFDAGVRGKSFVVATPTASGKSLCFHLPVLQTLLDHPDMRALYLYPTKALVTRPGGQPS